MSNSFRPICNVLLFTILSRTVAKEASPIEKVVDLIAKLEGDVVEANFSAKDTYDAYNRKYCQKHLVDMEHSIHIGKVEVERLNATILKKSAKIGEHKTKIVEITSHMHETEALLKATNEARETEQHEFVSKEKSLTEEISLMEHILQALLQKPILSHLKSATTLTESFQILVKDTVLNSFDASRLMMLASECNTSNISISPDVSSGEEVAAVDSEGGVVVSMDHSAEFIDTLVNLTAQAKANLLEARKREAKALEAYILQNDALTCSQNSEEWHFFGREGTCWRRASGAEDRR
jgi:hypothetical protein